MGYADTTNQTDPLWIESKRIDRGSDEQFQKGIQFETFVKPRLEALAQLENMIENDFMLFSYMPRMYPFSTKVQADYLISSHLNKSSFVFILQADPNGKTGNGHLCCSAFVNRRTRHYERNQRPRVILKKNVCIYLLRPSPFYMTDSLLYHRRNQYMKKETQPMIHIGI